MKSHQYQRVKDLLHKYTIIQPENSQVFCLMAQVLQQTNDIDHAKSWLVILRILLGIHFKDVNLKGLIIGYFVKHELGGMWKYKDRHVVQLVHVAPSHRFVFALTIPRKQKVDRHLKLRSKLFLRL
jgi:hypothetical protein